jgi:membrane protease YdiL (CAAX protease family)
MQLKHIFVDRYNEIRSGWRLAIFLSITLCLAFLLLSPFQYFNVLSLYVQTVCSIVATLAASFVMTRFINRKPFTAIGLSLHPTMFKELGVGCLLGFLMMTGIFVIEYAGGFITVTWRGLTILDCLRVFLSAAGLFAIAAFFEELLFRGYLFQTLMQAVTFLPAMLIMALLFAYAHYNNPNATAFGLVNVALAAVWLSLAYMKTRSLWFPLGLHFAWNFSQTAIYGFPTSGIDFSDKQFVQLTQTGPDWITGSSFGPEGGVLATLALILCVWYILKEKQLSVPKGIITLDSVEDLLKPNVTEEVI